MPPFPFRPPISIAEILIYSFVAFAIALLLTKPFVVFLHKFKLGKKLRVEAVDGGSASVFLTYHQAKAGTPTMGGLLIWGSILLAILLSRLLSFSGVVEHSLLQRGQVYIPLGIMIAFGILGAIDDYLNIVGQNMSESSGWARKVKICVFIMISLVTLGGTFVMLVDPFGFLTPAEQLWNSRIMASSAGIVSVTTLILLFGGKNVDEFLRTILVGSGKQAGLRPWPKLTILIAVSAIAAYWFYVRLQYQHVYIPFGSMMGLTGNEIDLGWLYVPFFLFVVIGTANAVNVTDGLDGLAGGLLMICFAAFGVVAYMSELYALAAFCGVVVGALAAFIWHNIPPALFFMGDTGSLALGGTLAVMAFMVNEVLILPLIGFVFVIEMLSVIIQLTSKRLRNGKKVFKSAPFHHHLEALDWGESKVTMRLWIVGMFTAFLGVLVGIYG